MADLGTYHQQFLSISRYLIDKGCISAIEQSRLFLLGFQQGLEAQVRQRLQQKFIDHFPDDPYAIADIIDTTAFILQTTAVTPSVTGWDTDSVTGL
jgi:hypothetical protein